MRTVNHKIETPHKLLGVDGSIIESGRATGVLQEYSPFDVKAHKTRVKEWPLEIHQFG